MIYLNDVPPLEKEVKDLGCVNTNIQTWPYGPNLLLVLITLDLMATSDQRNHVQMVVIPCRTASCVNHSRSDN